MRRRSFSKGIIFLALAAWPLRGAAPVPRPSPDLVVVSPAGAQTRLSSFKGKVVVAKDLMRF